MKGLAPLFLGIFGTFAFSWVGLTVIPNWQIGPSQSGIRRRRDRHLSASRNRECSSAARTFTPPTAACIATASRSAPITPRTISSENGVIAAAHHVITFSSARYSSEKCEWDRTSRTSARAHPRNEESPAPGAAPQGAAVSSPPLHRRAASRRQQLLASPATAPATSPGLACSVGFAKCHRRRTTHRRCFAITRKWRTLLPEEQPCRPSAQTPGAPWPIQTAGLAAMYSAAWHHVHLYAPRSINPGFEHAVVPLPLRKTTHYWRAFRGCIATFRFGCATRRGGRLFRRSMQNVWWPI